MAANGSRKISLSEVRGESEERGQDGQESFRRAAIIHQREKAHMQMNGLPVRTFFWPCAFALLRTVRGWQEGENNLHHA